MMKEDEAYEQLAWEKIGSLEGKKAIDKALNKVISFDLIRQAQVYVLTPKARMALY
jgi:hypothetical protein